MRGQVRSSFDHRSARAWMTAAMGGNAEFFRSVKQVFPVLSPEPEMTKDSVEVRSAPIRRIFQFWTTV
jgi:hypothetical protein